jgi:hypothetical protein
MRVGNNNNPWLIAIKEDVLAGLGVLEAGE